MNKEKLINKIEEIEKVNNDSWRRDFLTSCKKRLQDNLDLTPNQDRKLKSIIDSLEDRTQIKKIEIKEKTTIQKRNAIACLDDPDDPCDYLGYDACCYYGDAEEIPLSSFENEINKEFFTPFKGLQ